MLYFLDDKYLYKGVECKVAYINGTRAWLCPVEDTEIDGMSYLKNVTIGSVNAKGRDKDGNKAQVIHNSPSGAI